MMNDIVNVLKGVKKGKKWEKIWRKGDPTPKIAYSYGGGGIFIHFHTILLK